MKIYNEIVIDMNPESSSYGETLYEDSFEYEGPMMLAIMDGPTFYDPVTGDEYKTRFGAAAWGEIGSVMLYGPDGQLIEEKAGGDIGRGGVQWAGGEVREIFDRHMAGRRKMEQQYPGMDLVMLPGKAGQFEIDPTREQFRASVEKYGSFEEMAAGLGMREDEYEEFWGEPLKSWEQEYSTEIDPSTGLPKGTLAQQRGLDLQTIIENQRAGGVALDVEEAEAVEARRAGTVSYDVAEDIAEERLRAAEADYGFGMEASGLQAGRGLFDIQKQMSQQISRSGLATQGTITDISRRQQKGVMADYNLQQRQLAEGLTGAKTAFGISQEDIASGRLGVKSAYDLATAGIASGRLGVAEEARIGRAGLDIDKTQAAIDWERKQAEFWKRTEDEFYGDVTFIEGQR